uniref:Uncharacterized protein n=1 Tax=viral metagenome TaxID=1070528 RepID=A0A6C0LW88_9ZZZZ
MNEAITVCLQRKGERLWEFGRVRLGYEAAEPLLDGLLREDECTFDPPTDSAFGEFASECITEDPFRGVDWETNRLPYERRTTKDELGMWTASSDKADMSNIWNCLPEILQLQSYEHKAKKLNRRQAELIDKQQKTKNMLKDLEDRYVKAQAIFVQRRNELREYK